MSNDFKNCKTVEERDELTKLNPREPYKKPTKPKKAFALGSYQSRVCYNHEVEDLLKLFQSFPEEYRISLHKVNFNIQNVMQFMCEHNLVGKPWEEIKILWELLNNNEEANR